MRGIHAEHVVAAYYSSNLREQCQLDYRFRVTEFDGQIYRFNNLLQFHKPVCR